jgi:hypothetical protein
MANEQSNETTTKTPQSGSSDGASGAKVEPPIDDDRGEPKPGFGGEGPRSELGDPPQEIDERKREQIAERNRQVEREAERREAKREEEKK